MTVHTAELLGGLVGDVERFFDQHWQRRPLHRPAAVPTTSPWWLSLGELRAAISNPMLRAPFFLMSKDGAPVPASRITRQATVAGVQVTDLADARGIAEEFGGGATLVLRAVAEQISRVGRPCAELSRELGTAVIAHVFLTPSNARGFAWHRDSEDVLVVQLAGRKSWETAPIRRIDGERGVVPEDEPPFEQDQIEGYDLAEGDVLYVPTGCPHRAMSSADSGSVHLSIGIKRIEWMRVVNQALMAAVESQPRFAPLRPSMEQARDWLAGLGAASAAAVREPAEPSVPGPAGAAVVTDVLRAHFPGRTVD